MRLIGVILRKEWLELFKNKLILYTILFPPALLTILPIVVIYLIGRGPVETEDAELYLRIAPQLVGWSPTEIMQWAMANQFLLLFLIAPLIVPLTIAAHSIVGEKQQRSLEPLLATPITVAQLLLGKIAAAVLPAVSVTWVCYAVFVAVLPTIVSARVYAVLANGMWLFAMLVIVPLACFLSVCVGIIVSSRVTDPRVAQQIGSVIIVPLIAVSLVQIAGRLLLTTRGFVLAAVLIALVDALTFSVSTRLFQRESILIRWK